jgi:hypothetical protein
MQGYCWRPLLSNHPTLPSTDRLHPCTRRNTQACKAWLMPSSCTGRAGMCTSWEQLMWASLHLCAHCWICWAAAAGCTTAAAKAGRGLAKGSPRCCPPRAPCQAPLWMSSLWRASTAGASSLVGCAAPVTACWPCLHAAILCCVALGLRIVTGSFVCVLSICVMVLVNTVKAMPAHAAAHGQASAPPAATPSLHPSSATH